VRAANARAEATALQLQEELGRLHQRRGALQDLHAAVGGLQRSLAVETREKMALMSEMSNLRRLSEGRY
jgi:hypothetical protein